MTKMNTLASILDPSFLQEIEAEKERKRLLAGRVMAAKGLNKEDKIEICLLLTNEEPPGIKRGRRSSAKRDKALAFDYLIRKYHKKWTGIDCLVKKYHIPDSDHTTVYKAISRGIRALEKEMKQRLVDFEKDLSLYPHIEQETEFQRLFGFTKSFIALIEHHRVSTDLRRHGKK